jgi:hypothetical protein
MRFILLRGFVNRITRLGQVLDYQFAVYLENLARINLPQ